NLVRHARYGAFHDPRDGGDHVLDFIGIDIEAGYQDDILLPIRHPHVPALIHHSDIACAQPAVRRERVQRLLQTLPVTLHHLWSAHADFAHAAYGQIAILLVADRDFGGWQRQANRARVVP